VFSFGLTLFEMLTGVGAFGDQPPLKLLFQLRTQDLAQELVPQVDKDYRKLLTAMLARDATQRPSMSEVVERLTAGHASNSASP
jgi:serine/threonine protein kinase